MKKILLPCFLAFSLFASDENYIELGGGLIKSTDNFDTSSESIISKYNKPETENSRIPNLNFNYRFKVDDETSFYATSEFGDLLLGSEVITDIGMFDFGLYTSLVNEGWKNPYLLNTKREKTKINELGFYLAYGIPISEAAFSMLRYEYIDVDYKTDNTIKDLQRDAKKEILSIENIIEFNKNDMFLLNPFYEKYDAKGKASSYKAYGFELMLIQEINSDLELFFLGEFKQKEYKDYNTILNKKIESETYGINFGAKFNEVLPIKDTYVNILFGYSNENANHDFFNKELKLGTINFGYEF